MGRPSPDDAAALALAGVELARMAEAAAATFDTTPAAIFSASRVRPVVYARFALAAALHRRGITPSAIGRVLGRCHTTILDAIYRADHDAAIKACAERIAARGLDSLALMPLAHVSDGMRPHVVAYLQALTRGDQLAPPALLGLRTLAETPRYRALAEQALIMAGHGEKRWTIYAHAQQAGYPWRM